MAKNILSRTKIIDYHSLPTPNFLIYVCSSSDISLNKPLKALYLIFLVECLSYRRLAFIIVILTLLIAALNQNQKLLFKNLKFTKYINKIHIFSEYLMIMI